MNNEEAFIDVFFLSSLFYLIVIYFNKFEKSLLHVLFLPMFEGPSLSSRWQSFIMHDDFENESSWIDLQFED